MPAVAAVAPGTATSMLPAMKTPATGAAHGLVEFILLRSIAVTAGTSAQIFAHPGFAQRSE
ncbi:hypothetical protein GCM10022252_33390 [Streptosporangium oxazolinicum]|uniref:Uncharacterized protein n=1 Tax=Streptosporangium oxazolinicum TaxID=909287 RepID=A0ABP8AWJ3_9ACTN